MAQFRIIIVLMAIGSMMLSQRGCTQTKQTFSILPQEHVSKMLDITWKVGPSLPHGFQDSDGGFLGNTLITVGGFCQGKSPDDGNNPYKPGKYTRGFLKSAWGIDLSAQSPKWVSLPDLPGDARQEHFAIPVGNALYMWGGFSYSEPYTYKDGYRLSKTPEGRYVWDMMPELPWPLSSSGICAIGSKIYIMGGGQYDYNKFVSQTDFSGKINRMGARLFVMDTENRKAGWTELAMCPGTPRLVQAMAAVKGKIYVIGGATADPFYTVVDNWMYNPRTNQWKRLRDTPVATGNFPSGEIAFKDRYVVLVGGAQYTRVANPDGTSRAVYGHASRMDNAGDYNNDVFVYDTVTNRFGTADKLPINNNLPMMVLRGDKIYLIGGEADAKFLEGEYFGHHPDLLLIGSISVTKR